MASELFQKLGLRRNTVDEKGQSFESAPAESGADASHLRGLTFDAPEAKEWLKERDGDMPEEDAITQPMADKLLADRGDCPHHAPTDLGEVKDPPAELLRLQESVQAMKEALDEEQRSLGLERAALQKREAEIRATEDEIERNRLVADAVIKYPRPRWLVNYNGTMNVAVTGNSGVGKSLLINRLRRIRREDEAWAEVSVGETTMKPDMYPFPGDQRIRLWDLPGAGTPNFPSETYIRTMGLRYFDRVLIVTAGRFTSTEVKLKEELEKYNVPYYMVRTKVDIDIYNNMEDNKLNEVQTLATLVEDYRINGVTKAYLVSLREPGRFDMPGLMKQLFPGIMPEVSLATNTTMAQNCGWEDAWAVPEAYGPLACVQGRWKDAHLCTYIVQGDQTHVALAQGQRAIVSLTTNPVDGCVWWINRWWTNATRVLRNPNGSVELHWAPSDLRDEPLVWTWLDC